MDGVIVVTGTIFKAAIMMAWKTIEIEECLPSLYLKNVFTSFQFVENISNQNLMTTEILVELNRCDNTINYHGFRSRLKAVYQMQTGIELQVDWQGNKSGLEEE